MSYSTEEVKTTCKNYLRYSMMKGIWLEIQYIFYWCCQKVPSFDGQKEWQPFKKILKTVDHYEIKMKIPSELEFIRSEVMSLKENTEKAHFLIQIFRLPENEKTLRKLFQIALNIGQLEGSMGLNFNELNLCPYYFIQSLGNISVEELQHLKNLISSQSDDLKNIYFK